MLLTIVLTAAVVLGIAMILLLAVGRRIRVSSRLLGLLLAAVVSYGGSEVATRIWQLVASHAVVGAGLTFLACLIAIFALPYWNPVGQVFLGSYAAAALTYLALAAYITLAGDLSALGIAASTVLFGLELLALLLSGYFAFEGCDVLCRTRATRAVPEPDPNHMPKVSLHVPAYNEPADMLIETIKSLEQIDYPNLEIIVVDNNTPDPETWRPVAEYCEGRDKTRFVHVESEGFKAGALNTVISEHLGPDVELIGVVDADYLIDPGYLRRVVGYFANPNVAFVQSPQDYREYEGDAYLTACYDAYSYFFRSSMPSRNQRNSIIFAGTMGVIRRSVLEEIGGWPEWCITEDSETSLRMLKAGYEGVYVEEPLGRGIMPLTFATFKSQRFRWCFGGIQIFRKHLKHLLPLPRSERNRLSFGQRMDYLFGTGLVWFNDLLYLGFTVVLLITAYLVLTQQKLELRPLFGSLVLLPAALIASGILRSLWSLRHRAGLGVGRSLLAFLNWLSVSWTVAMASLQALIRSKMVFMRTPKEEERQSLWTALRDAKTETGLALLLWGSGVAVALSGNVTPFLVVLFAWQGTVYGSSLLMSWLNVRTKLTPELERRRRTEILRERAAALFPYYAGASVALLGVALVGALLLFGGRQPGSQPDDLLEIPRSSEQEGVFDLIRDRVDSGADEPSETDTGEEEEETSEEEPDDETTPDVETEETPTEEESPTPESSPTE
jgi:cellulose synthase/poly-beta-1,6-N-acetylglucosamine synthase-like glycosyltransferase